MISSIDEVECALHPKTLASRALPLDTPGGFWREAFARHPAGMGMCCFVGVPGEAGEMVAARDYMGQALGTWRIPPREAERLFAAVPPVGLQRLVRLGNRLFAVPCQARIALKEDFAQSRHQFWLTAEVVEAVKALLAAHALDAGLPRPPAPPRRRL